jgi:sugar lactone lactonase YvrE
MTRTTVGRIALSLLFALAAGCSYDSGPGAYGDPSTPPPTAPPTAPPAAPPADPPISPINGIWTSSAIAPGMLRIATEQLDSNGAIVPATVLTTPSASLAGLNSVAFDNNGTLWIASQEDSVILGFTQSLLVFSRSRVAPRIIRPVDGSLSAPSGLAFDRGRHLWVSNQANGSLVRYHEEQLAQSGAPVPVVTLSGVGSPTALAFDAAGALWMADTRSQRLYKFGETKISETGAPIPDVVLTSTGNSIEVPTGIAFDSDGNLWVVNATRQTLVRFTPSQLAASGSPVPDVVLSMSAATARLPTGLAFDREGNLWVINVDGVLSKFDHAQLAGSGAPVPAVKKQLDGRAVFWSLAFWPKPIDLPLN